MSFLVEREVRDLLAEAFARTGLIGRDDPAEVPFERAIRPSSGTQ